jgi:hypothetical protein
MHNLSLSAGYPHGVITPSLTTHFSLDDMDAFDTLSETGYVVIHHENSNSKSLSPGSRRLECSCISFVWDGANDKAVCVQTLSNVHFITMLHEAHTLPSHQRQGHVPIGLLLACNGLDKGSQATVIVSSRLGLTSDDLVSLHQRRTITKEFDGKDTCNCTNIMENAYMVYYIYVNNITNVAREVEIDTANIHNESTTPAKSTFDNSNTNPGGSLKKPVAMNISSPNATTQLDGKILTSPDEIMAAYTEKIERLNAEIAAKKAASISDKKKKSQDKRTSGVSTGSAGSVNNSNFFARILGGGKEKGK